MIGVVYVFNFDSIAGTFSQQQMLFPLDGMDNDQFGQSVSINGDFLVVGSPSDDDNGTDSGYYYIFCISYK